MSDDKAVTIKHEIILKEIEVAKLDLKPTDIIFFKIISEDLGERDFNGFARSLQERFPNNKVMVTMMYPGTELEIYTVSSESKPAPAVDCSVPTSFCNDCACGKKERILAENNSLSSAKPAGKTIATEADVDQFLADNSELMDDLARQEIVAPGSIQELDLAVAKDFNDVMKELEQKGDTNAAKSTDEK